MQTSETVKGGSLLAMLERAASIGVWRLALADGTLEWSPQLDEIHGAQPGYVPTGEPLRHYAPEDQLKLQRLLDACAREGTPFDEEAQVVRLDGRRAWVRTLGEPVRDEAGTVVALQGAVQEIAPRGRPGTLLRMGAALGSGEAFATVDRNGQYTYVNEQAEQLLGADSRHLLGRRLWNSFQKTVRLRLDEQFRAAFESGQPLEFEELDARLSHWFEVRGFPFGSGMAIHLRDVTARRKAQEQLRLLEGSISRLNDIVIITEAGPFSEPGPRIVFVNEAFERRTGYSRDEVLGRTPRLLQGPNTQRRALDKIRAALEEWRPARVDLINYKKNGEPYWVDLDVSPVWDKQRKLTHWVAVGRDVTERKIAEEKIQHLAFYDALTKLPNRQLLMDRLHAALADPSRPREGALMFIDLDNFKVLNDTLGHQKGDMLLQLVAERLRSCVAKGDTVARLGGDEFVILLENRGDKPLEPSKGARAVAERILAALGEPYVLPGYLHHSTCSIGVTLFGKGDRTVSELLKQADLAMYQAKRAGRNTVCFFDPEMQAVVSANAALSSDLRQAWRENQFRIDYQPQVSAAGRLIGLEALLRWQHPQRGLVPPDQFIPAAEETSLIVPIGRWVLDAACAQLAAWEHRPDRRHLSIAVNVSVRQFRHPEFVDEVMAAVQQFGVKPNKLKLELTESLLADGIDVTIAKMGSLKEMGVALSLDDFGIGYSSLSYLKRLPLDQLKIDREFVKDVLTDANDAAIAKTVINLAHSLDLDVIAEGVETQEQRDFLVSQGCLAFQGYLFCRPLPLDELEAYLDRQAAQVEAAA
ncbi:MAG TPA: EAL domain-containing protein [Ramlibacter sp.]|jgi:diguanylate cyclase (GGDEF)-like protein/PAS domain S-box-containing protein|uniref:sensor domain-containing protein n=1 Tax=Ramlibacter sp. TaxID=1917967 RepID=UPI002D678D04|nr:EAL domain-containing protein [Ramlibacter sp.]HZY19976.1 EAL domain-containing protein [Ramlibacter sp.]